MFMLKIVFNWAILALVLVPFLSWAHPGPVNQYGGHRCLVDCVQYGLHDGDFHLHSLWTSPSYLSGYAKKQETPQLFYLPGVSGDSLTKEFNFADDAPLSENPELDKQYCQTAAIYAPGKYFGEKVRIKPVCVNDKNLILADAGLNQSDYYQALPNDEPDTGIVYHVDIYNGIEAFTDRPELAELKGKLIQGLTDKAVYFVYPYSNDLELRKISEDKAISYFGSNYQEQIIHFTDSIIFTFNIGDPIL